MKILRRNKTFLSALLCFLAIASLSLTTPSSVYAGDDDTAGDKPDRWYLSLGIGRTWDIDQTDDTLGGAAIGNFDHRDKGILKFEIGLTFFKYFAVEFGIINFSKLESNFAGSVNVAGTIYTGTFKTRENLGGATATAVWHIPFYKKGSRVATFFVKGGIFRWRNKLRMRVDPALRLDGVRKTDDVDPTASFGVQVRGEGASAFRFEVQRFEIDDKEINTAFINFVYYY